MIDPTGKNFLRKYGAYRLPAEQVYYRRIGVDIFLEDQTSWENGADNSPRVTIVVERHRLRNIPRGIIVLEGNRN
jgi:hypothetical protein